MERSSIVEFKYLKIFVIRGHKRSLEVIKGQMEGKHQNVRKINTMGMIIKFKVKGQGQGQGHYYYCYSPIAHSHHHDNGSSLNLHLTFNDL